MYMKIPQYNLSGKRLSGKRLSGTVIVRERSCSGNVLSGKGLVREMSCPRNDLSGKRLSGKVIVWETSVKCHFHHICSFRQQFIWQWPFWQQYLIAPNNIHTRLYINIETLPQLWRTPSCCFCRCIDGYSRKILWLKASSSNHNPAVIASYFMSAAVDQYVDYIYRTAPGNQRIEAWWSFFSGETEVNLGSICLMVLCILGLTTQMFQRTSTVYVSVLCM